MQKYTIAAFIVALTLSGATAAIASSFPSAAVDRAVNAALTSTQTPGATIAVIENGHIVYAHGYGLRDVQRNLPAGVRTHYEIGSMTKQFTAAAILQLRDAGKLSLDAPLSTYLPTAPHARKITIRELLLQTTGLPNYTAVPHFTAIAGKPGKYNAVIALIAKKPLLFTPGTNWRYSNTNYILLGRVIQVTSHESYTQYIREHELKPAGMTHTFTMLDEPKLANMARGYVVSKAGKAALAPPLQAVWAWSAGDIVSTVGDFAKWMRALTDGKIISAHDYAEMTAPGQLPTGASTKYGFGLQVGNFEAQPRIAHNGGTFGFSSDGAIFPKQHLRIVTFTNSATGPADGITASIFNVLHPRVAMAALQPAPGEVPAMRARILAFAVPLLQGHLLRSLITPQASKAVSDAMIKQVTDSIAPLGKPLRFIYRGKKVFPAGTAYVYLVRYAQATLKLTLVIDKKSNLFSGFFVSGA